LLLFKKKSSTISFVQGWPSECLWPCRDNRLVGGADAVVGDEGFGVWEVGRDAGGGDAFAAVDAGGHFEVEVEELFEEVFLRRL
jgi:hypothetical protein